MKNWVIYRHMDGPRECHVQWSKSEREKQVYYINAYMWNLEKWYRQPCLRNGDANVENKCMATRGEGRNWEVGNDTYMLLILYMD